MGDAYTQLFVHLVWATWDRRPLLVGEMESRVYESLKARCDGAGLLLHAMGGMPDHVHILVGMPATLSVAEAVKHLKGGSSRFAAHSSADFFRWQGGYGAFSVSRRNVDAVASYILHQREHHAARDLVDEYEVTSMPAPSPR